MPFSDQKNAKYSSKIARWACGALAVVTLDCPTALTYLLARDSVIAA
jgi:hypothetical protein